MNDEQLNRQLRAMVDGAAAPLSQTEVVLWASGSARKSRRDWHLTEHRLIVVAVAAVIAVVFFVPLPSLSLFNRLSHTGLSSEQSSAATIPAGWVPVTLGDARISVPESWWVLYNSPDCPRGKEPGEVLVNPTPTACSKALPGDVPKNIIELYPFHGKHYEHRQFINGITVYWSGGSVDDVPSLGISIAFIGPLGQRVLDTLTRLPNLTTVTTPSGWVPVAFGDAQVSVPPNWAVMTHAWCGGRLPPIIQLGSVIFSLGCSSAPAPPTVTITPLASVPARYRHERQIILNGIAVLKAPRAGTAISAFFVPSLHVTVSATSAQGERVLETLTASPRSVVLAAGPAPAVPSSWKKLSFQGLAFAAPAEWPVEHTSAYYWFLSQTMCPGMVSKHVTPLVILSTDRSSATCFMTASSPPTPRDGLEIASEPRKPTVKALAPVFSTRCFYLKDLRVCPATSPAYSILVLRVTVPGRSTPAIVSIGLAGDGMTARTILYSMGAGTSVPPQFRKFERAATSTTSLPGTIPSGGVALKGDELVDGTHPTLLYLEPATAVTGMMSAAQAERHALKYDNAPGLRATGAVLATVTAPSDVPPVGITPPSSATIGTVAWVVEISLPKPVAENDCLPSGPTTGAACTVYVSHDYVVLDPTTGAFRIALS
jgi:hypothetical protein